MLTTRKRPRISILWCPRETWKFCKRRDEYGNGHRIFPRVRVGLGRVGPGWVGSGQARFVKRLPVENTNNYYSSTGNRHICNIWSEAQLSQAGARNPTQHCCSANFLKGSSLSIFNVSWIYCCSNEYSLFVPIIYHKYRLLNIISIIVKSK